MYSVATLVQRNSTRPQSCIVIIFVVLPQPLIFSKTQNEIREASGLSPKLTIWKKIAFGVGAMPYAMCNTVVGFYLSIFLLEVAIVGCNLKDYNSQCLIVMHVCSSSIFNMPPT